MRLRFRVGREGAVAVQGKLLLLGEAGLTAAREQAHEVARVEYLTRQRPPRGACAHFGSS
jgi:hypothetical protein